MLVINFIITSTTGRDVWGPVLLSRLHLSPVINDWRKNVSSKLCVTVITVKNGTISGSRRSVALLLLLFLFYIYMNWTAPNRRKNLSFFLMFQVLIQKNKNCSNSIHNNYCSFFLFLFFFFSFLRAACSPGFLPAFFPVEHGIAFECHIRPFFMPCKNIRN